MRRYKLEDARNLAGISQQQLADELGVSFVTVARWEAGTQTPESPFIGKLCKRFRVKHPRDLNLDAEFNHNAPTQCREEILEMLRPFDRRELIAIFSQLPALAGIDLISLFSSTLVAPDNLLSLCRTVINQCWMLEQRNNAVADNLLPECVTKLDPIATHASPDQHHAAALCSEATVLQMIIAAHQMNYQRRAALGESAVKYGRMAGDNNIHIMTIGWYGSTYTNCFHQPEKAIDILSQALPLFGDTTHLNQSDISLSLAMAHALDGNTTMSQDYLEQAHMSMPEHPNLDPLHKIISLGHAELDQREGDVYLELAKRFPAQKEYPQLAYDALAKAVNQQGTHLASSGRRLVLKADAARVTGEMHDYLDSLTDGVRIAFQMRSEKQISKAVTILNKAPRSWRTEQKYIELRKLLTPNIVTQ